MFKFVKEMLFWLGVVIIPIAVPSVIIMALEERFGPIPQFYKGLPLYLLLYVVYLTEKRNNKKWREAKKQMEETK